MQDKYYGVCVCVVYQGSDHRECCVVTEERVVFQFQHFSSQCPVNTSIQTFEAYKHL